MAVANVGGVPKLVHNVAGLEVDGAKQSNAPGRGRLALGFGLGLPS